MKKVLSLHAARSEHWVGDGFPVRTVVSYADQGQSISPFLLLDYAGPAEFPPSDTPRGVGEHPHRGFETVTIVFQGELEHRDSAGHHGLIGPGDVQWMTAGSGVVHEEKHSRAFTARGGTLEVVQLWVNLPAAYKMSPPRYQELLDRQIPSVALGGDVGSVRIIAGTLRGITGRAQTFTPINLWDLRLMAGAATELTVPSGCTTALFVVRGEVVLADGCTVREAELALLEPAGERFRVEAREKATVLVLNGQPIDEPVVGHGPFVMNTQAEIDQAIADYRGGKMGHLGA
ncbi:MAG TPA: pirin family protein [Methylococcus sp.]|nr:pirin family protein [Methylococcus sp.]